MKRLMALIMLLWAVGWPVISAYAVANNPLSPNAITVQGADPTGNQAYPIAVVGAPGADPLNVNVVGGANCVTQCTSPWIVGFNGVAQPISGTVTANQGNPGFSSWLVSVQNASIPVTQSGTWNVGLNAGANNIGSVNQGTSPWIVGFNGVGQPVTQSGTWTVQQGTPPWSVSQSGSWNVGQSGAPWTQRIQDGVGATLATVTAGNALKVDGSAVTQPVSGTVTANQGGAPWSVTGTLTHNGAAPTGNNVGALTVLANAAAPTYTEGRQALLSTDLSGNLRTSGTSTVSGTVTVNQGTNPWIVAGNLTNNNAAPTSNNVGVLPAIANAAAPTYTEGRQVLASTDLSGYTRVLDNHPTVYVTVSFTRPANTTTYTAKTYLSNSTSSPTLLTIPGCARFNGGTGRIVDITAIDEANQGATTPNLVLYIFDSTSVTAHNDNSAMAESASDIEHCITQCSIGSTQWAVSNAGSGAAGNLVASFFTPGGVALGTVGAMGIPFQCQAGSTSLAAILEMTNAYVPVSAEKFVLRLGIQQD